MERQSWTRRLLFLLFAVICLHGGGQIGDRVRYRRDAYRLVSRTAARGVPPEYVLANSLLGGFRGIFITTLWVRAQGMKQDGDYHEMVDIYNIITKLQPNHHMAWAFQAWDLTYNVSVEHTEPEERAFWVFRGINLLRNEGVVNNPNIPELYYELAWMFFHKVGLDMDMHHPYYRRILAMQTNQILRGIQPDQSELLGEAATLRERFPTRRAFRQAPEYAEGVALIENDGYDLFRDVNVLLNPQPAPEVLKLLAGDAAWKAARDAGLWMVAEDLRTKMNMDAGEMYRLSTRYGPIDWMTVTAHSLYWAEQAYKAWKRQPAKEMNLKYWRVVYFNLIDLAKRGKSIVLPNGYIYYMPDMRFLDAVVVNMDEAMEYFTVNKKKDGTTVPLGGMTSGYINFLKDAVFQAYFAGDNEQALRMLKKLAEVEEKYIGESKYRISLREYVLNEFHDFIYVPDLDDAMQFLSANIFQKYQALALRDVENYERVNRLIDFFYNFYSKKRWKKTRYLSPDELRKDLFMPPLEDTQVQVALQFFDVRSPTPDWMRANLAYGLRTYEPAVWHMVEKRVKESQARQGFDAKPVAP